MARRNDRSALRKTWQRSGLTQREFTQRYIGVNPRTNKPYHERTLRKWLSGEIKKPATPITAVRRGGGTFQQTFYDADGNRYSAVLLNPYENSIEELFTREGEQRRLRSVRRYVDERLLRRDPKSIDRELTQRYGTGKIREKYRPVTSSRGLRLGELRRLRSTKAHTTVIRA